MQVIVFFNPHWFVRLPIAFLSATTVTFDSNNEPHKNIGYLFNFHSTIIVLSVENTLEIVETSTDL